MSCKKHTHYFDLDMLYKAMVRMRSRWICSTGGKHRLNKIFKKNNKKNIRGYIIFKTKCGITPFFIAS